MYMTRRHCNQPTVLLEMERFMRDLPLLPLTKASPYDRLFWPLTYSSVFSSAMFMYPSTDCSSPASGGQQLHT